MILRVRDQIIKQRLKLNIILDDNCITNNTFSFLQTTADKDANRKEDYRRDDSTAAKKILHISTTVCAALAEVGGI